VKNPVAVRKSKENRQSEIASKNSDKKLLKFAKTARKKKI
jgi:hypothetical protein